MDKRKTLSELRSRRWFGVDDLRAFGHRSRARQMGYDETDWDRPIIGIINTWSDINQCHAHFPDRVQWVKRGILQAGGMPIELPALSLSEPFVKPTPLCGGECSEPPIAIAIPNYRAENTTNSTTSPIASMREREIVGDKGGITACGRTVSRRSRS